MDEIAVGIGLVLFGYAAYSALRTPTDFSSQVIANPRKNVEASPPPAKAPVKKEAAPAVKKETAPVAKAPPPAAKAPPVAAAEPPAKVETVVAEAAVTEAAVQAAVAEPPAAETAPEVQEAPRTVVMLKNPATGEIAPLPADYRFAKKWIKDALVSEGLLDRIYKNSELDRKNRTRIREALERLKAMPKYAA